MSIPEGALTAYFRVLKVEPGMVEGKRTVNLICSYRGSEQRKTIRLTIGTDRDPAAFKIKTWIEPRGDMRTLQTLQLILDCRSAFDLEGKEFGAFYKEFNDHVKLYFPLEEDI